MLADKFGQYLAVLLERPNDETWQHSMDELLKALGEARVKLWFEEREERRGDFDTIAFGVSYGGGQTVSLAVLIRDMSSNLCLQHPGNLKHSAHNRKIVEELLQNPHMERMARHARSKSTVIPLLVAPLLTLNSRLRDLLPRPLRRVRCQARQPLR